MAITKENLIKTFDYKDGKLFYKANRNRMKAGDMAGCIGNHGYNVQNINKRLYLTHRLIWIYHYGRISKKLQIDHIDGNRENNKIENLRLVKEKENHKNTQKAKGYTFDFGTRKYRVRIQNEKKVN